MSENPYESPRFTGREAAPPGTPAYPLGSPREYRYRKHIRWIGYAAATIGLLFGVALLPLLYVVIQAGGFQQLPFSAIIAVALGLFLVVESAGSWYVLRRLAAVRVSLHDDALVYRNWSGERRLPFDQRMSLRFASISYLGGWLVVKSDKETVRLTVVVEGIGQLLRELKAALDIRGLSQSYDPARLFRFFKTAEYADQSWERFYATFWKFVLFTFVAAALGMIFARVAGYRLVGTAVWVLLSGFWPYTLYVVVEIIFARRLAWLADKEAFTCPARDPAWEKRVFRKAILVGLGLYLLGAAAVFAIPRWLA